MAREGTEFSGPDMTYTPTVDGAPSRALVATPTYAPPAPVFGGFAPRGPEILHGGFNQTWLANCLRRRWLMATLMGLLIGAGACALLLFIFPNMTSVTSYLQVRSSTGNEWLVEGDKQKPSPAELQRQAMNHLTMLKSPMVLNAALEDPNITDLDAVRRQGSEAVLWLTEEIKVSFPGDGEILEVRYEGEEDPKQMEAVIDAVVHAYQEEVLFKERLQAVATQTDLTTVLKEKEKEIQEKLAKLKASLDVLGLSREEIEIPTLQNEVRVLEQQIAEARKEELNIQVMLQLAVNASKDPAVVEQAVAEAMDEDPTMVQYKAQEFELRQAYRARAAQTRNPADAQLRRLQTSIQQTLAEARDYRAAAEKDLRDQIRKLPNSQLRQAYAEAQIRDKAVKKQLKDLNDRLTTARQKLDNLGVQDPDIEMLRQDIANQTEIANSLAQKVAAWQVMQAAAAKQELSGQGTTMEKVSVIQQASALADVNTIERYSIAGVGGVAAMGLTCYAIALMEFRRRRLNSPTDVDEGLGVRVLGVLPPATMKSIGGNSLVATQVAESIDNVRATLMHDSTSAPRQVVMVTSSGSQEGTTVVASSLALSLARAGRRTLLVDADLRSPSLHKLFGMPVEEGFCEALRSEIDLADAIRPTNNEGLYLLTAGICSHDAVYALATDQPQAIFEKLRDQFDFVIIDAPPALGISDALSLGQYVDGAILTVLRDQSEIRNVHKTVELLRHMGIRLIGSVVNGVPLKADRRVVRLHQSGASRSAVPQLPSKSEA